MGVQAGVSEDERVDDSFVLHDLLYRLFHEEGVRVFEPRPLTDACRCSREKLENVLKAMPRAEIEDLKRNGAVEVTCEFCTRLYRFDGDDLDRIYSAGAHQDGRPAGCTFWVVSQFENPGS